jgi:hypothetical protein
VNYDTYKLCSRQFASFRWSQVTGATLNVINASGQAITQNTTYSTAGGSQLNSPTEYFYGTGYTNASGTLGTEYWGIYNQIFGGSGTAQSFTYLTLTCYTPEAGFQFGHLLVNGSNQLSAAGTQASPFVNLEAQAYDTAIHYVEWDFGVVPTTNAGASQFQIRYYPVSSTSPATQSPTPALTLDSSGNATIGNNLNAAGINTAQAPQSLSSSFNTVYTNNTGKNKLVTVTVEAASANAFAELQTSPNNVTYTTVSVVSQGSTNNATTAPLTIIVPNGYSYKVVTSGTIVFVAWTEQTF